MLRARLREFLRRLRGRTPAEHHEALSERLSQLEDSLRAASAEVRRLNGSRVSPGLLRRAERRLKRIRRRTQKARLLVEMSRSLLPE